MPQVHLDTIPIWDAYKLDTECPLCALEDACEKQFLDIALGGAMMEPDTRIATNERGFCSRSPPRCSKPWMPSKSATPSRAPHRA